MTTLIRTGNGSGKKGRCDARCYEAITPICQCCCGGMNHGVGLRKAAQNTQDHAEQLLANHLEMDPEEIKHHAAQGNLFDQLKERLINPDQK